MGCLDEKELSSYLDEDLDEAGRMRIERHLAECRQCLDLLMVAYDAQRPSASRLRRIARTILNILRVSGRRGRVEKKKSGLKWLLAALCLFALSFILKRFFLQFLAAAVVLGFKWVMEGEGARKAIMIFKGIKNEETSSLLKERDARSKTSKP